LIEFINIYISFQSNLTAEEKSNKKHEIGELFLNRLPN